MRTLTARELNRASLARQMLLERVRKRPAAAIHHLVALQAQEPSSPYIALWSRLAGFRAESLDRAFLRRSVVKATLMRGTLHVVSARDYRAYQPAMAASIAVFRERTQHWPAAAMPLDEVTRRVVAFASEPRTGIELRDLSARLAGAESDRDAWRGVRLTAPFINAPSAVPWSFGRRPDYVAAQAWVPGPFAAPADGLDLLVRRYLRAFGPATLADVAQWLRLDRAGIRASLERLGPRLRRFHNEAGQVLFDVRRGLLPAAGTPAPVRFLPMWDSLLLAYQDRSRIIPARFRTSVVQVNGDTLPTFLVDGTVAGLWHADQAEDGRTVIRWSTFEPLADGVATEVAAEAERLAAFVEPQERAVYRSYHRRWVRPGRVVLGS
jgi:hypothetical protein